MKFVDEDCAGTFVIWLTRQNIDRNAEHFRRLYVDAHPTLSPPTHNILYGHEAVEYLKVRLDEGAELFIERSSMHGEAERRFYVRDRKVEHVVYTIVMNERWAL